MIRNFDAKLTAKPPDASELRCPPMNDDVSRSADAYTIFETMKDRGLSLSPTDMLKGYLLANIADYKERAQANDIWKEQILKLTQAGKEEDAACPL